MAFVLASTSAIDLLFSQRANALRQASSTVDHQTGATAPIRRPYRGIQIKDDTYATMQIVDAAGMPIPLVSESYTGANLPESRKGQVEVYADFILQKITEERVEKSQIIETFGDSFVFFFGERPRMLTIQGMLVNTEDFSWRSQFMYNYENYLRGTRLVQRNARLYLSWDSIVIDGYPLNVAAQESSDNPYAVDFQMQIFLTNYNDFGRIGIVDFPGQALSGAVIDALNRDLDERRDAYISTATEVRRLNFLSRGLEGEIGSMGGLGAFIREGIRGVNSLFNLASTGIQTVATLLSGRVVRTPIGVAGFIAQVGQGGVTGVGLTQALLDEFTFGGITDTKLRIPARSRFASTPPERQRTRISENYDEYPLYQQYDASGALVGRAWSLSQVDSAAAANRQAARELRKVEQSAELVAANNLAKTQAGVLDAIQDTVQLAKTGFAIFNTTRAVLQDPGAVALDSLGLSGVTELA